MTSPLCKWLGRRDSSIKVISQLSGSPYSRLNLDAKASRLLLKIKTMLKFQSWVRTEKNPSHVPDASSRAPKMSSWNSLSNKRNVSSPKRTL